MCLNIKGQKDGQSKKINSKGECPIILVLTKGGFIRFQILAFFKLALSCQNCSYQKFFCGMSIKISKENNKAWFRVFNVIQITLHVTMW